MSLVAKVSDLITAAAGIDPERGDQVTVETMKIDAIAVAEEAAKAAEQHAASRASERSMRRALHYGSFLLMAAMVAATLYLFLRRLAALPQPAPAPAAVAERAEPGEETEVPPVRPDITAVEHDGEEKVDGGDHDHQVEEIVQADQERDRRQQNEKAERNG